ncbi:MAG: hypothetical protein ACOCTT_04150 [archaeon]
MYEQIRQLEEERSKLQETLWMSYDFDTQFEIKTRIEQIDRQIEELREMMKEDNPVKNTEYKDAVVEIIKESELKGEKTPAYIGYTADEEKDIAFFSDADLEEGDEVEVQITGTVPSKYDYLMGKHAGGFIPEISVDRLVRYLKKLNE